MNIIWLTHKEIRQCWGLSKEQGIKAPTPVCIMLSLFHPHNISQLWACTGPWTPLNAVIVRLVQVDVLIRLQKQPCFYAQTYRHTVQTKILMVTQTVIGYRHSSGLPSCVSQLLVKAETSEIHFPKWWQINLNKQISGRCLKCHMPFNTSVALTELSEDWIRVRIFIPSKVLPILIGHLRLPGLICRLIAFYTWAKDLSSVSVVPFILQITYRRCAALPRYAKWDTFLDSLDLESVCPNFFYLFPL